MGIEGNIFENKPTPRELPLGELSLEQKNEFQASVATLAYQKYHPEEDTGGVSDNKILLWWINEGYAAAFGDVVVPETEDSLDISDPDAQLQFLEELESMRTKH